MALAYISVISGKQTPNLHPLHPNIGLTSCNSSILFLSSFNSIPIDLAMLIYSYSYYGKNSWSGGSNNLTVTGLLPMASKIPLKSSN